MKKTSFEYERSERAPEARSADDLLESLNLSILLWIALNGGLLRPVQKRRSQQRRRERKKKKNLGPRRRRPSLSLWLVLIVALKLRLFLFLLRHVFLVLLIAILPATRAGAGALRRSRLRCLPRLNRSVSHLVLERGERRQRGGDGKLLPWGAPPQPGRQHRLEAAKRVCHIK